MVFLYKPFMFIPFNWEGGAMSRKYKFHEKSGTYFVSFAMVYWINVFIQEIYFEAIIQVLAFCRKNEVC